jgi:hypothetical protein
MSEDVPAEQVAVLGFTNGSIKIMIRFVPRNRITGLADRSRLAHVTEHGITLVRTLFEPPIQGRF